MPPRPALILPRARGDPQHQSSAQPRASLLLLGACVGIGLVVIWAHASAGVSGNGQDDKLIACLATGWCKQHCPAAAHAGYRFCALKRFTDSSTAEDSTFYVPGAPKQEV